MDTNEQLKTVLTEQELECVELFKAFVTNTVKFRTKGTASAAARARKNASSLTHLFKRVRKTLQADKVARVAERRAAKLGKTSV